jgi:hypothetical protein
MAGIFSNFHTPTAVGAMAYKARGPALPLLPTLRANCWVLAVSLSVVVMTGCGLVRKIVSIPTKTLQAVTTGGQSKPPPDPVAVQQTLTRFTDEYMARMVVGIDGLLNATNPPNPTEVLRWKVELATETCSIVSGPNAVANLLDMTVFVTAATLTVDENWNPKVFGEAAVPLQESCRNSEEQIWQFAGTVLTPEQRQELRHAIEVWHKQNPQPESVLGARTAVLAPRAAKATAAEPAAPGSVFSLLKLDPLSSLDPATRELAQTRLFAERALYVAQKLPMLLRWQTELLSLNTANLPAIKQLITNSTGVSAAVERFATVAEKLPAQVRAERQETFKALQAQEETLTPLVSQVREALAEGTQMSTSLNTTFRTFDTVMAHLGVGKTNKDASAKTNSEPFRILDYAQSAAHLEAMARQVSEMLITFDQTLGSTNLKRLTAQVSPAIEQAKAGGKEIVDYAFWRWLLLVSIVLVIIVLYRLVVLRLTSANRIRTGS